MNAYSRITEVKEIADYLTESPLTPYKPNMKRAKWKEIIDASTDIGYLLSSTAIDILDNAPIQIVRDPFKTKTTIYLSKSKDRTSDIIFPTIFGKEDYKPQLTSFYGLVTGYDEKDEYGLVLANLYEYFYFLLHNEESPEDEFAIRNITKRVNQVQAFLMAYKNFFSSNRSIERHELEHIIKICLQSFSSLEISLQLAEQMQENSEEPLRIADEIIKKNRSPEEIIKSRGIESAGYKTLKKTIDRFRL